MADLAQSGVYTVQLYDPATAVTTSQVQAYLLTPADGAVLAATASAQSFDAALASGYFAVAFVAVVTAWVLGQGFQAALRAIRGRG